VKDAFTLRSQLLLLIGGPLLLLVLIETLVSYRIGSHTANLVFDRWLLDSAYSLGQELEGDDEGVHFRADEYAVSLFEWDEADTVYFRIALPDGQVIAGEQELVGTAEPDSLQTGPVFSDGTMQGKPVRIVSVLGHAGVSPVLITVAETLNKRRSMRGELLFEVLVSKTVLLLAVLLIISAAFDRGFRPLHMLGRELAQRSPQDLTPIEAGTVPKELRSLVENTNRLLGRIETAINAREQFIGNIAHQIRTPLAGMKLQAQLAQEDTDPAFVRDALARIVDATDHMAHVNTQLLKLARAEAAFGRGLRRADIDLVVVVRSCCAEFGARAMQKGIHLVPQVPPQPVTIVGGLTLLCEMVGNLIDNAITYGLPGGHVWIRVEEEGGGVQLVVEDDGPGIPREYWSRIFERFFRPSHTGGNGCGLGLSIVREIALAHGTEVQLEERAEGAGTKFVVRFPQQ